MIQEREITVDIGCGKVNNLKSYGLFDEPTIALDTSRSFLEQRAQNGSCGNLIQADAANLPISTEIADHVFAIHTLEHVTKLGETLGEMIRVLKPGGMLTLAVPHERYERVMGKLDSQYFSGNMHQRIVDVEQLKGELASRDIKVTKSQRRGFRLALYNTFSYLVHRKILKDREIQSQSGCLVKTQGGSIAETPQKDVSQLKMLARKIINFGPFNAIFDALYPFETYIEAVKEKA